jgi:broad specificity phosphatase PhoE
MKLILVRHGETRWNRENRVVGSADIGLNDEGRKQVKRLALVLKGERVDAIYSSPLSRAWETAQEIARFHDGQVKADDAFKEMDAGELDGLTYEEMRVRYGEFIKQWLRDPASLTMPGGESLAGVQERAWLAVERMREKHPDDAVMVVSHNFVILCIICKALGLDLGQFRRLRLNLASISILNIGQRGTSLILFNDTCHLGGEDGG